MANGIRITANNSPVSTSEPSQFAVDSENPLWLCDLKKRPKNYGIVKVTINSLPAFSTRTLLSIVHGYKQTPSFITQWFTPNGNFLLSNITNQTYGIGNLGVTSLDPTKSLLIKAEISPTLFVITVDNSSNSSAITNMYAEMKYYIFANSLDNLL